MSEVLIRPVQKADIETLRQIYAYYVEKQRSLSNIKFQPCLNLLNGSSKSRLRILI